MQRARLFWLVAADLVHTELLRGHAGKLDLGDELKSVAASERTMDIEAVGKRDVLCALAIALN